MPESTRATRCRLEFVNLDQFSSDDRREHQLCNALSGLNLDAILTQIDEYDLDLATIVSIYGTG